MLSDNNYSASEKNKVADSFQKLSDTSDDILEGVAHLFLTVEERAKISNAFLLNENTDILTEGNMNLFVTPAEKAKWNGNRTVYPVANIAERDNLITNPPAGVTVQAGDKSFVIDDGDGKHAEYTYTGSMWLKTGDPDWANVITDWANITGKPTTLSGFGITDAVDTSTNQNIGGNKTLTGLTTIPTLVGTWGLFSSDLRIGQNASSVSDYKANLYSDGSVRSMLKFTNGFTGQVATDGFDVGILADGTAEIRQRENLPLNVYVNNTLALGIAATGEPTGSIVTTTGANAKLVKTSGTGNIAMTQSVDGNVGVILNNTSTGVNANTGFQAKSDMLNYLSVWAYGSGRTSSLFGKTIGNKTTIVTQGADCTGMLLGNLTNVPITIGVNSVAVAEINSTESAWSIPLKTTQLKLSALNSAPASSTATGTIGDISIDANYIHVCVATNTWKRTPLTW